MTCLPLIIGICEVSVLWVKGMDGVELKLEHIARLSAMSGTFFFLIAALFKYWVWPLCEKIID